MIDGSGPQDRNRDVAIRREDFRPVLCGFLVDGSDIFDILDIFVFRFCIYLLKCNRSLLELRESGVAERNIWLRYVSWLFLDLLGGVCLISNKCVHLVAK